MEYAVKECGRCGVKTSSYKLLEIKNKTNNNYKKKYFCHGPNTINCYDKVRPMRIGDIFRLIFAPITFVLGFIKKVLGIFLIPIKIIMYPFKLVYRHNKKIRNAMVYIFGIVVFILMKVLAVLRFVGIKVMDQDGDGKVDLNDFAIAKRKVRDFFDKSKKETK